MDQSRVLLVDDDTDILEINKAFLEGEGYEVSTATSIAQTMEKVQTYNFDCIVLAMGVRPNRALAGALEEQGIATVTVGDAVAGGTIGAAVHSAFDAAMCVRV